MLLLVYCRDQAQYNFCLSTLVQRRDPAREKITKSHISKDHFKHSNVKTLFIFFLLKWPFNYGGIWKMRAMRTTSNLISPQDVRLMDHTTDPKWLKLLKKNGWYFYVHLSSNHWQKLSQDVRCCVQNCSLVLVCMFVFYSLFQLKRRPGGTVYIIQWKRGGTYWGHIIFNNNLSSSQQVF